MRKYVVQNIWVEVLAHDKQDAEDTVWAALERGADLDDGTQVLDWGGDITVRLGETNGSV